MRKAIALLAALVICGTTGCSPQRETPATSEQPGGGTGAQPAPPRTLKVGLVTDAGGIDDQSFNASAWAGLKRAEAELGVTKKYVESRELSDYKTNLSTLAEQGNDLVIAVGYLMEDALKEIAPGFPNTKFAIIDGNAPDLENCVALKFREEEGCFLAGYLAGRMSKTGALGFVGGMEGEVLKRFECGYIAGARAANPRIRVIPKYVGSWTDVPKGKEIALAMFRDGADILFAAAGKSGLGVLDAVNERGTGYYGIGVDADQDHLHKGRILTSMMKGVDTAVFDTVKALKEGNWVKGERVFGLKENGVRLSPMRFTKKDVPPDVLAKIDELARLIADGGIKVPRTDEELQNFVPQKL